MREKVLLVTMVVSLLAAGCMNETPEPVEVGNEAPSGFSYTDDRITIESINASRDSWVPTLQEPPEWTLGQWWKVRVTEEFTGETSEAYRVVAGQEKDFWLVGMPTHDFSNDLMVLHIPGFGQVAKEDLAFEAHDIWFNPLKFPLEEDTAAWKTGFEGANNLQCSVMDAKELVAEVECVGKFHISIVYDARMRAISNMTIRGYGSYEVIDHGFAFHEEVDMEPVITVPHMADLIFYHGRVGQVLASESDGSGRVGPGPRPTDVVTVDSTYDRVSFIIMLGWAFAPGALPVDQQAPGVLYKETVTAPDGASYESTLTPTEDQMVKIESFKHDAPGGDWQLQHVALGPGMAFMEGIGYHVYDIELPSGHLRPSIGEHQHGSGEGH